MKLPNRTRPQSENSPPPTPPPFRYTRQHRWQCTAPTLSWFHKICFCLVLFKQAFFNTSRRTCLAKMLLISCKQVACKYWDYACCGLFNWLYVLSAVFSTSRIVRQLFTCYLVIVVSNGWYSRIKCDLSWRNVNTSKLNKWHVNSEIVVDYSDLCFFVNYVVCRTVRQLAACLWSSDCVWNWLP